MHRFCSRSFSLHITPSTLHSTRSSNRGIALLIVVSILTVIAILGVSFAFSMYLETQASIQFAATAQARYLAESGVSHARAILDEDRLGSRTDDLTESWIQQFTGQEVDVNGDGTPEAKWWALTDAAKQTIGRYGVFIRDEAGKVNLNAALADPEGSGVDAINLTTLLNRVGIANANAVASAIEHYRYGPDAKPGVAQVDDDRDGAVDEPDEYQPLALRGDDRQFETVEELLGIGGLTSAQLQRLAPFVTVYSWDQNVSVTGKPRFNLNTASADELLGIVLETGAENPWQMAANMADYIDVDAAMSRLTKVAAQFPMPDQGPLGDWHWDSGSPGVYTTEVENGTALEWTVSVPTGTLYVLVHGRRGMKVGDVDIAGQSKPSMESDESFGRLDVSGPLTVRITCREPQGTPCAFHGLELAALESVQGLTTSSVRGVEAIRFNELMINPTIELATSDAVFDPQASGWNCTGGSCSNSGTGQARWSWTNRSVQPGRYYVRVYGSRAGQTVGEVRIDGRSATLVHGARHPETITVDEDQKITVTVAKTPSDGTYYFQKLSLSSAPDAEYVELINVSGRDLDLGGWLIEGEAAQGRQARLPDGSLIKAHGLLVAAVDAEDGQEGLAGNRISARAAWSVPDDADVVQLEFPEGPLTPDSDWLSVTLAPGTKGRLVLRAGESVVDEIVYPVPLSTTIPFQSLEKGDPTVVLDADHDGIDEGWYPALKLYTPGAANDNEGLRELRGLEQIVHNPSDEVTILNRPLQSVGELAGLPSGIAWHVVTSEDLAKIVDRLTVEGLRLETAAHFVEGDGWRETAQGYEANRQGATAAFQWLDVPDGQYHLSLYGWTGEQLSVRWQLADQQFSEWIPTRSTDAQGRIIVGQVTVGMEQSPHQTFSLQVRCDSPGGVCHLSHVMLDPQLMLIGTVNLNTAPLDILMSLPGMTDSVATRLIAARPFGDQGHKARGIGDLLLGSVLGSTDEEKLDHFRQLARMATVRSHVFDILSVGESLEHDKPAASKRIHAIIQR